MVADGFDKPNGLAFSPDERVLYVGDTGERTHRIEAFDVVDGHALDRAPGLRRRSIRATPTASRSTPPGRVYARPGRPACRSSTPTAHCVGEIDLPGAVNFAFGGADRTPLITADDACGPPTPNPPRRPDPCHSSAPAGHRRRRRRRRDRRRRGRPPPHAAHRVVHRRRRPLRRGRRDAPHARRPDRQLARRRRQGADRRDLRAAQPRDGGAGHRRPPRRARAARRLVPDRRHPAEGRRRGRRRDRHQRRDARRGRGDLDRRRRRGVLDHARSPRSPTRARAWPPRPSAPRPRERGVAPVVSAVDAGGELMFLVRPDAAQVASVEVTTDKARTAAIYRRPSKDFEDQASGGRPSALHLARAVPLQGGDADRVRRRGHRRVGVSGARVGRRGPASSPRSASGLRGRARRAVKAAA